MTEPRLQMLADLMAQYTALFPEDPVVMVAGEVSGGEVNILLLSNMEPHDTHDMLDSAASYSNEDQQGVIMNAVMTAH